MGEAVVVALISGGLTLLGVIVSNNKHQAVTDTKMEELTREVREHNNFAKRVPVLEEQVKVINHRESKVNVFRDSFRMLRDVRGIKKRNPAPKR